MRMRDTSMSVLFFASFLRFVSFSRLNNLEQSEIIIITLGYYKSDEENDHIGARANSIFVKRFPLLAFLGCHFFLLVDNQR